VIAQGWKCSQCGFTVVSLFPPEKCPRCNADRSAFKTEHEFKFPDEERDKVFRACWSVSYGLYLVSSIDGEKMNGQICNTLFQITSDPPRVAVGINHANLTHEYIEKSGVFAASVLGEDDVRIVRRFGYRSGREFDKFKGVPVFKGKTGCPIYQNAVAYIECAVIPDKTVDAGTHSIFVADIVGGAPLREGAPMTYAFYHETKDKT
jgi:flavin reductase (DIM6/NTAB) family NADH-FMN oxidoreductase RutF